MGFGGLGVSMLLVAAGAILLWAVEGANTAGWILLVVGGVGALLTTVLWSSAAGSRTHEEREIVVDRR